MQSKLNLRSVEGPLTWLIFKRNTVFFQRFGQVFFCTIPDFITTDTFFWTGRQFHRDFFKAEDAIHVVYHLDTAVNFVADLFFSTENMRIILSEATHAHQTMQGTRWLIAMAATKFTHTQRQITIRFQTLIKDLNVPWAVHWFDAVLAVF